MAAVEHMLHDHILENPELILFEGMISTILSKSAQGARSLAWLATIWRCNRIPIDCRRASPKRYNVILVQASVLALMARSIRNEISLFMLKFDS